MLTHTLGFPRIGADRELKKTLESYWRGRLDEETLLATARELRLRHWTLQAESGMDLLPVNDFSLYDIMLDTCALLGCVPERYGYDGGPVGLERYFRMARGGDGVTAMEMTKWFDTNYHYIVPEFRAGQTFGIGSEKIVDELAEAQAAGFRAKPVLPGPVTFMLLGKSEVSDFDRWSLFPDLVEAYCEVLRRLAPFDGWIQLDEPALCLDLDDAMRARFAPAYAKLQEAAGEAKILLATYFGDLGQNRETALALPVDALHVDLVSAPEELELLLPQLQQEKTLSLGLVNGRNIWIADLDAAVETVRAATSHLGSERVMVAPSCSLLHVPFDLETETDLNPEVRAWLAFARQKCGEVNLIAQAASGESSADEAMAINRKKLAARAASALVHDPAVQSRLGSVTEAMSDRGMPFAERVTKQNEILNLPPLPTTTIGSFPQTKALRAARRKLKRGELTPAEYDAQIHEAMADVVRRQVDLGLDVLVHGECERNDMVEYFGEQMRGYCFTSNGWVQSYGSRCVKPPILYGDVSRPEPMTVEWTRAAAELTDLPMKGMLTGPVTMLCWSFVRDDQPLADTCRQLALAVRDEVQDLEAAGIGVIQIDEPALREGLPLRRARWDEYFHWAVYSFRLATAGVRPETQIHTHMCYSEFNSIMDAIARMDADVISIEASRSRMDLLDVFEEFDYPNDIGPGVYDIHSPRVPSTEEMVELLHLAMRYIPAARLWVNPDCGLKTRDWPETTTALANMVEAARQVRSELAARE